MTSAMTFWKTVLYMLQYTDLCGGGEYNRQNDLFNTVLFLWIPNGIWILVPFIVIVVLWNRIIKVLPDPITRAKVTVKKRS